MDLQTTKDNIQRELLILDTTQTIIADLMKELRDTEKRRDESMERLRRFEAYALQELFDAPYGEIDRLNNLPRPDDRVRWLAYRWAQIALKEQKDFPPIL